MIDFKCLFATYQIARRYRDVDAHVVVAQQFPRASGHHPTDGLDGNLGTLLFVGADGMQLGKDWIAPSKVLRGEVRQQAPLLGDQLLHYCKDNTIAMVSASSSRNLPVRFHPATGHANDSECVLLNTLNDALVTRQVTSGEAWLLTERLPCASCTAIIIDFLKAYPQIALHVVCLADYVNAKACRSHVDFYRDLKAAGAEAQLYKLDIFGSAGQEEAKVTVIPPDAQLLGYSPEHIYPGAPRFAGVVDGKRVMTTWSEADAHNLRTIMMIAPASSGPRDGPNSQRSGGSDRLESDDAP